MKNKYPQRRKVRELVLKTLFQRERIGVFEPGERLLFGESKIIDQHKEFFFELIDKTSNNLKEIDSQIQDNLKNWKQYRLSDSLNSILRMSTAELLYFPSIEGKIVINEALELCRIFVDEKAIKICNGVLNSIWKIVLSKNSSELSSDIAE